MSVDYIQLKRRGCSIFINLKYWDKGSFSFNSTRTESEFKGFSISCYKKQKGQLITPIEFETWEDHINVYGAYKPTIELPMTIQDESVRDFGYDRLMYIHHHFGTMPIRRLYSDMIQFAITVTKHILESKKATIHDKELNELLGVLEEELTVRSLYHR